MENHVPCPQMSEGGCCPRRFRFPILDDDPQGIAWSRGPTVGKINNRPAMGGECLARRWLTLAHLLMRPTEQGRYLFQTGSNARFS